MPTVIDIAESLSLVHKTALMLFEGYHALSPNDDGPIGKALFDLSRDCSGDAVPIPQLVWRKTYPYDEDGKHTYMYIITPLGQAVVDFIRQEKEYAGAC